MLNLFEPNRSTEKKIYFKKHEVIELFLLRISICIFVYPKKEMTAA